MNPNPRIELLKELLQLEEQRGSLQHELNGLQERLSALQQQLINGSAPAAAVPAKTVRKRVVSAGPRTRRGVLKDKIMAALESAGSAGIQVKELAEALGTKAANVHSWFHSTAKRNPAIIKIDGGHYRLDGAAVSPAAVTTAPTKSKAKVKAKAKAKAKPVKVAKPAARGTKPGGLSERIFKVLEKAGAEGVSVKDIAEKVGAKYKNISIWFATTGKTKSNIKKVGPALYTLA